MNPRTVRFIVLTVLALAVAGCGKKGDPFLPKSKLGLVVQELQADLSNNTVVLRGRIPLGESAVQEAKQVAGMWLYHTRYGIDAAPCEGCPIDFPGHRQVKGKVLQGDQFSFTVRDKAKQGIHFFQVRLMAEDGGLGPPSNVAKLIVKN